MGSASIDGAGGGSRAGVPVVLHHGIFAFDELRLGPVRISQFPGVERALAGRGFVPMLTRAHPCASIARRAADLKKSMLRQVETRGVRGRVVLVAHSLGGLDARYAISRLGLARHVAALVTISTPHRGASLADFWQHHLDRRLKLYGLIEALGLDLGAARDLTREAMAGFNAQTPDHPDVAYYSITCSRPFLGIRTKLMTSFKIVERAEGENDGVVSVASAKWGTHLDHWPIDHISAVNRPRLVPLGGPVGDVAARYVSAVERVVGMLDTPPPPPAGGTNTRG